ncbi:MAG: RluA family pseudouridine synthase [Bacteroidetes bacterium]|nr:MAG: RluA family pseudouridine synthase [Bacteroidota bacterium]
MSEKGHLIRHYSDPDQYPQDRESEEDDLFDHYTLRATKGQSPVRIDKFLANLLPFTTRSKIKTASQTGSITVNGKSVKLSYKVQPDDVVKIMMPYPPPPRLEPEEIPLDIRYEDDSLIVLHKPAGMVCHPAFGHRSGTLVHGLLWHFDQLPQPKGEEKSLRPGLVHRLDKDTTGLMVVAKSEYAMAHLSKQFFDRTSDRTYLALVWGDVKEEEGRIEAHIGRHPRDRKLYDAFPDGSTGKHAVTHYEVLERFGVLTLIRCKLETGRTHQIRVHLKYLGHPLFGDETYGGDKVLAGPPHRRYQQMIRNCLALAPRQALHAKTLAFTHPKTGERLAFDSDIPADMEAVLEKLRVWRASF